MSAPGDAKRRSPYDYITDVGRRVGRDEAAAATGAARAAAHHVKRFSSVGLVDVDHRRPTSRLICDPESWL